MPVLYPHISSFIFQSAVGSVLAILGFVLFLLIFKLGVEDFVGVRCIMVREDLRYIKIFDNRKHSVRM